MPAARTATITPSGPVSAGSGRVSTRMAPGPSMTTVRMCSFPLSQNEIGPFRFAYRGPVFAEAPRADRVDLTVGILEIRMLDGRVRPHHLLDLGLGPLMPLL